MQHNHQSFVERLRAIAAMQCRKDPWLAPIESLKGEVGRDGVERVSTVAVFEAIGVPLHERTPAAGRRLRALMERYGWAAVRQISLTPSGSAARLRGYARIVN